MPSLSSRHVRWLCNLVAGWCLFVSAGCSHHPADGALWETDRQCAQALKAGEWEKVDSLAAVLKDSHKEEWEANACYYLGTYRPGETGRETRLRSALLERAARLATESGNDTLLARIHNVQGVRSMLGSQDYSAAIMHFRQSMQLAHKLGHRQLEAVAELNLSELSRVLGDTLGHRYDRLLFDYARSEPVDSALLVSSAFHCAGYCLLGLEPLENYQTYVDAVRGSRQFPHVAKALEAMKMMHDGNADGAVAMFDGIADDGPFLTIKAKALVESGQYSRALVLADTIYADTSELLVPDWLEVQPCLAEAYLKTGRTERAYAVLKDYVAAKDSMDRQLREVTEGRYRVEYGVAKKDAEIAERRAEVRTLTAVLVSGAGLVLFIGIATAWYLNRRRKLYRDIVRQNQLLRREAPQPISKDAADVQPGALAPELVEDIWQRITSQMEQGIWSDPGMSREAFADRIGCNRTYLGKVIKQKTGLSYPQFINAERIRQAMNVISDPADTTPLRELSSKLGFTSVSTFYNIFKQAVGMSPGIYRDTARAMHKDEGIPGTEK